jgi:Kef-type K+ transport system membrane component KefB
MLPLTDPVLIVAIAMLVFLIAPAAAERLRVPGLIGVIICGAVLGPNAAGLLARDATIVLLGTVGLLYLVFLAGLELDLHKFAQYRRPSMGFGALSFGIPMALAAVVMPWLGFDLSGTLLLGAIIGSHTLLAYPIASRLGLIGNRAVTVVVGGTLVTDTLALGVLAVITGALAGGIGVSFWLRLLLMLALYVGLIAWGVPKLGRWFFRRTPGQPATEFLFLMTVLFVSAYLATLAGAQPIIGAFLAGLTLNRLIPNEGPNMNRVRFVGNAFFVPFFLLSVGMLVDPAVLLGSEGVWLLSGTLIVLVHAGKLAAALLSRRLLGHTRAESMVVFGLSLPQAAATLAVTFVGLEIGLFDETVVNAVVMMILVTCLVGPSLVERFGQTVALAEETRPIRGGETPQRIMVPMANPATARDLMDLALIIREPGSREPIYPVTVVPSELSDADQYVAEAEKMLSHAVAHAAAADSTVIPVTRMDHNFANGIARAVAETRSSTLIIGWDGRRSPRRVIFGTVTGADETAGPGGQAGPPAEHDRADRAPRAAGHRSPAGLSRGGANDQTGRQPAGREARRVYGPGAAAGLSGLLRTGESAGAHHVRGDAELGSDASAPDGDAARGRPGTGSERPAGRGIVGLDAGAAAGSAGAAGAGELHHDVPVGGDRRA